MKEGEEETFPVDPFRASVASWRCQREAEHAGAMGVRGGWDLSSSAYHPA